MAYAVAQDVQDRFVRTLDADEQRVVGTRLDDAERLIKKRITDLDAQIAAGTIDQADVVQVEAEMVLRLVRNPDGYISESEGDYSYSVSARVASGKLEVMPDDWALLGIRGGVFTIAPYLKLPWGTA